MLLDDFKEMTSYWKLKEGTLDRALWKNLLCKKAMDLSQDGLHDDDCPT